MATKTKAKRKARAPFIPTPAAKPTTQRLAHQIQAAAPGVLPWPNILLAITNLLGMFFPCLLGPPTPAKLQSILTHPGFLQKRRIDNAKWKSFKKAGGLERDWAAFSLAVDGQLRVMDVPTVAALMAENK